MNRLACGGDVFDGCILGMWGEEHLKDGHEGVCRRWAGHTWLGEGYEVRTPLTFSRVMESASRWLVTLTKSWKLCRKSVPRKA